MTLLINKLNEDFSYTSQIVGDDIAEIVSLGFKTIINNRPDNEGGDTQPKSEALEALALKHGIAYVHIPVVPNNIQAEQIVTFGEVYAKVQKPILGFCKTGNRASTICKLALENHA